MLDPVDTGQPKRDFDEFSVTGHLRIDDQCTDAIKDMGLNNACPVGSNFTSITGILDYSFNNFKLTPRGNEDVIFVEYDPFVPRYLDYGNG